MFARKMLLHSPLHDPTPAQPPLGHQFNSATTKIDTSESFDFNNIMTYCFSGFLCLLVFSICIRCMFKCLIWITNQIDEANNLNNKVVVRNGVDKRALNSIPKVKYSEKMKKEIEGFIISTECVICLYEFKEGERVRILPKCNHSFHVKCIDLWLKSHSSCPTCRQSLVDTCQILIGSHCDDHTLSSSSSLSLVSASTSSTSVSASASASASASSRELNGDNIEPLEREDFVRI
ncbi:RING-H2 finger protein ATL73-like [Amaranthus tricolor]|uniref:RING-H2 finger protein ATL73-like n=1 Tax=Amaranthus tricolor TaxID=29722 RepID=UPI00258BFCEC|nr:RING-H2 finger protein ATL73-like [Amaranthus tricolor]